MHIIPRLITLLLMVTLIGCGASVPTIKPYKMDIQQGNIVTSEMLLKLRPGMTKSQVQFIMGTPLLVDSFHTNRWDYFYQLRKQGKIVNQRRVILDFDGDSLKAVRGDVVPEGTDIDALMQQPQTTSETKRESKAAESLAPTPLEESDADVIATPIEAPEIESTVVEAQPAEEASAPQVTAEPEVATVAPIKEETSMEVAPLAPTPETTAKEAVPVPSTVEAADEVEPVVETDKVEDVAVTPQQEVERVIEAKPAPIVEIEAEVPAPPVVEAKPAVVEAPVVAAPEVEAAEVQPVEEKVETVETEVEPVKVENAAPPPVTEPAPKTAKTRKATIPAPPVVESTSRVVVKPKTKIPAPPVMGKPAKASSPHSSEVTPSEVRRGETAAPPQHKADGDLMPYEEETDFFERTLEMIGF